LELTEKTKIQFDKLAVNYEKTGFWDFYFKYSARRVAKIINNRFQQKPLLNLLDLGCGTGTLLLILSQKFSKSHFLGLDLSQEMLKIAGSKLTRFKIHNVELQNLDVHQFETNDKFDVITCLNSFHHYSDYQIIISKIRKMLKDDGMFILVDPIRNNFLRKIWIYLLKHLFFEEPDVRYFSRIELNSLFSSGNFMQLHRESLLYFVMISVWTKTKITLK
jgi:ubiquinone/menaquinone biosynthesis C-methylase UbiE